MITKSSNTTITSIVGFTGLMPWYKRKIGNPLYHTSYIIHHTSYLIPHTSYRTSYIISHHTSYIIHHTSYKATAARQMRFPHIDIRFSVFLLFSEIDTILTVYFLITNRISVLLYMVILILYILSMCYQVKVSGYKVCDV